MKRKLPILIATTTMFFILIADLNAQNWRLGGNPDNNPFAQGLLTQSNYFGATETANVRLGTGNVNRMLIRGGGIGNTGNNDGRIGIGNNLPNNFVPNARLHLHQTGGFNAMKLTNDNTGNRGSIEVEVYIVKSKSSLGG